MIAQLIAASVVLFNLHLVFHSPRVPAVYGHGNCYGFQQGPRQMSCNGEGRFRIVRWVSDGVSRECWLGVWQIGPPGNPKWRADFQMNEHQTCSLHWLNADTATVTVN